MDNKTWTEQEIKAKLAELYGKGYAEGYSEGWDKGFAAAWQMVEKMAGEQIARL